MFEHILMEQVNIIEMNIIYIYIIIHIIIGYFWCLISIYTLTYTCDTQSSYECALLSLGSTVELMEQILKRKVSVQAYSCMVHHLIVNLNQ